VFGIPRPSEFRAVWHLAPFRGCAGSQLRFTTTAHVHATIASFTALSPVPLFILDLSRNLTVGPIPGSYFGVTSVVGDPCRG
jgi:hypothetical protein